MGWDILLNKFKEELFIFLSLVYDLTANVKIRGEIGKLIGGRGRLLSRCSDPKKFPRHIFHSDCINSKRKKKNFLKGRITFNSLTRQKKFK